MTAAVVAVIVAAGSSARMGSDKLWATLLDRPVIAHSLAAFAACPEVDAIVVVAPRDRHEAIRALGVPATRPLTCVEGGARRQDSVAAGLAAAPEAGWVLVHDAARPLVTPAVIRRVLAAARADGAAVPVVPLVDTVKRVADGRVEATVDRAALRAAQTPQAAAGDILRRAYAEVQADVTDDASLLERLGIPVTAVEGDPANIKITTPPDLLVARALLEDRTR